MSRCFREENERRKNGADEFEKLRPHNQVLYTRQTLEPLRRYTVAQFSSGSVDAEMKSAIHEINAMADGLTDGLENRLPLEQAAHQELEVVFLEEMDMLLTQPAMWNSLLDDSAKTVQTNADIYRLWAGIEASMEQAHIEPNASMPTRMFAVDESPSIEPEINGLLVGSKYGAFV